MARRALLRLLSIACPFLFVFVQGADGALVLLGPGGLQPERCCLWLVDDSQIG